jgi:hypothetical protein
MSKGSTFVSVRLGDRLIERIETVFAKTNKTRREEPYTRSSWIISAIMEKLKHQEAAQRQQERRRVGHARRMERLTKLHNGMV